MQRFRFHQSSAYGKWHRLRAVLLRIRGGGMGKSQRLYFVTLNGHRYKRLILQDSGTAKGIEGLLERLSFGPVFPRVVTRYENELWLEFVEGRAVAPTDPALVEALAGFYAALHHDAPRLATLEDSRLLLRLGRDLDFLRQAGVLDDGRHARLWEAAHRLAPETLWMGLDYVDPVLKNFVLRDDGAGLCAVDAESLVDDYPLGTGIAKALLHWLRPWEDLFWSHFETARGPAIRAAFPFVELCFVTRWTKTKVLTGKHNAVDSRYFERFLTTVPG